MSILSENIKYYRKQANLTQSELAKSLNIVPTSISAWENGRNKPLMDNVEQMAEIFKISKSELLGEIKLPSNLIEIKKTKNIPVLGVIACGEPILAEENIVDSIAFPSELLPSGKLFFLTAKGDSMEPVIKDRSLVMIRRQEDCESGEIAAVLVNGDEEATLKRVRKLGEMVLLEAINEDYEPYIVTKDNPARIIGKAMKVLNDL